MDQHVNQYFREFSDEGEVGHFHKVIALHESPTITYEEAKAIAPLLPKGWYELAQLHPSERLEFIQEHWQVKMPYHPKSFEKLLSFFNRLDDIGIYLTQKTFEDPILPQMVYSLKENSGFYHGYPAAQSDVLASLQEQFPNWILPRDYIAFLEIHDGFSKYSDTGLTPAENVPELYETLQTFLSSKEPLHFANGDQVNPHGLIPFYESFGLHCYQCFTADWFPESEMGNVYYSGIDHVISDPAEGSGSENQAFPTFIDWLAFYTESAV